MAPCSIVQHSPPYLRGDLRHLSYLNRGNLTSAGLCAASALLGQGMCGSMNRQNICPCNSGNLTCAGLCAASAPLGQGMYGSVDLVEGASERLSQRNIGSLTSAGLCAASAPLGQGMYGSVDLGSATSLSLPPLDPGSASHSNLSELGSRRGDGNASQNRCSPLPGLTCSPYRRALIGSQDALQLCVSWHQSGHGTWSALKD